MIRIRTNESSNELKRFPSFIYGFRRYSSFVLWSNTYIVHLTGTHNHFQRTNGITHTHKPTCTGLLWPSLFAIRLIAIRRKARCVHANNGLESFSCNIHFVWIFYESHCQSNVYLGNVGSGLVTERKRNGDFLNSGKIIVNNISRGCQLSSQTHLVREIRTPGSTILFLFYSVWQKSDANRPNYQITHRTCFVNELIEQNGLTHTLVYQHLFVPTPRCMAVRLTQLVTRHSDVGFTVQLICLTSFCVKIQ